MWCGECGKRATFSRSMQTLHAWLSEFFDPEIERHDAPSLPGAAVYRGHDALRRHIEDYLDAWADSSVEIRSVGDRVLTRGRYVGVGRQSGISLEDNVVMGVYDLHRGQVLRVRQFVDEAEALEAVGLSEKRTGGAHG
jgi:ketosteroid isomerase-like protein